MPTISKVCLLVVTKDCVFVFSFSLSVKDFLFYLRQFSFEMLFGQTNYAYNTKIFSFIIPSTNTQDKKEMLCNTAFNKSKSGYIFYACALVLGCY